MKKIGGLKFSFSADFSKMNSILNSHSAEIIVNEEYCYTEKVERNKSLGKEFQFTDQFTEDVKSLPLKKIENYDNLSPYFKFLDNYGTEYFTKIIYGAK